MTNEAHATPSGHFLRFLRFLRNTLVWRLPIGEGGRIGSKTSLHEARAAVTTLFCSTQQHTKALHKFLTAKWGEKPLCPQESCNSPPESESRVHTIQPHALRKKRNKRKKII
jgi:hypothetical protein